MMRTQAFAVAVVAIGSFFAATNTSSAQYNPGYNYLQSRPTVSPYLNLLNNNSFGIPNYQTMVRPEVEARDAINRQGASLQQLQQQFREASQGGRQYQPGVSRTGHGARYMNYSHYYSGIRR
jgi:hypothetical protein